MEPAAFVVKPAVSSTAVGTLESSEAGKFATHGNLHFLVGEVIRERHNESRTGPAAGAKEKSQCSVMMMSETKQAAAETHDHDPAKDAFNTVAHYSVQLSKRNAEIPEITPKPKDKMDRSLELLQKANVPTTQQRIVSIHRMSARNQKSPLIGFILQNLLLLSSEESFFTQKFMMPTITRKVFRRIRAAMPNSQQMHVITMIMTTPTTSRASKMAKQATVKQRSNRDSMGLSEQDEEELFTGEMVAGGNAQSLVDLFFGHLARVVQHDRGEVGTDLARPVLMDGEDVVPRMKRCSDMAKATDARLKIVGRT